MSSDRILIDTNVFVYAADSTSPKHPAASAVLDSANVGHFLGCVTPQILLEFISVVTNPRRVTVTRTAEEAWAAADQIASALTLLHPPPDIFMRTSTLGRILGIKAQDVFDLMIGVTAIASGVTHIYSYDADIFTRIPGITVKRPEM